jgi:DNA-binding GntR family transcriptional regulator
MALAHPAAALIPTLPLQIAEQLSAAIIDESYQPGGRLKENELAVHFSVSRSTIREALRILELRGLVRILPQRGAVVTNLTRRELEDLFEIRAFLVGLIARRVASEFREEDKVRIDSLFSRLQAARDASQEYAKASAAAAIELANLSRSEHLVGLLTSFAHQIGRYTRLGLLSETRRKQSLQLWQKLFVAIKAGAETEAEQLNTQLALENRDAALRVLDARNGSVIQTSRQER